MQPYKETSPTAVCYLAASTSFIDEQYAAMTITLNKWLIRQQMKNTSARAIPLPYVPSLYTAGHGWHFVNKWIDAAREGDSMDCSPHFCPDLVSNGKGRGRGENEHEKWDTINSIAAESVSCTNKTWNERSKVQLYFNSSLFSDAESKRMAILMYKEWRNRELW